MLSLALVCDSPRVEAKTLAEFGTDCARGFRNIFATQRPDPEEFRALVFAKPNKEGFLITRLLSAAIQQPVRIPAYYLTGTPYEFQPFSRLGNIIADATVKGTDIGIRLAEDSIRARRGLPRLEPESRFRSDWRGTWLTRSIAGLGAMYLVFDYGLDLHLESLNREQLELDYKYIAILEALDAKKIDIEKAMELKAAIDKAHADVILAMSSPELADADWNQAREVIEGTPLAQFVFGHINQLLDRESRLASDDYKPLSIAPPGSVSEQREKLTLINIQKISRDALLPAVVNDIFRNPRVLEEKGQLKRMLDPATSGEFELSETTKAIVESPYATDILEPILGSFVPYALFALKKKGIDIQEKDFLYIMQQDSFLIAKYMEFVAVGLQPIEFQDDDFRANLKEDRKAMIRELIAKKREGK